MHAQDDIVVIQTVTMTGNEIFTNNELFAAGALVIPGTYRLQDIDNKLAAFLSPYHDTGYLFAEIESYSMARLEHDDHYSISLSIKEGSLFLIRSVVLSGVTDNENRDLQAALPKMETRFTKEIIDDTVEKIAVFYEDYGYPYTIISNNVTDIILSNDLSKNFVDLEFEVAKNKFVEIDSIVVSGIEYTRPDVIIREGRIAVGDIFREKNVGRSREYIGKLPYLSEVSEPELFELENGKSILRYAVTERKSNNFSGLVGYVPSSSKENGYYVGTFMMDIGNMFGSGRKFQSEWQRLDRSSQKLRVFYEEPWIAGIPLSINGQFEQSFQDSSYVKRTFSLRAGYQLNSSVMAHVSVGSESVIAEDQGKLLFDLVNSSSTLYSAGITYNSLDYRLNPRQGVYYSTSVTHQNRSQNGDNTVSGDVISDKKINADLELAYPLKSNVVSYLHGSWNQTTTSGSDVPVSERWYLGGSSSIRGYREKQFLASKVAWFNLELRHLNNRESRVFLFFDGGLFQDPGKNSQNRFGYGFGFRVDSRLGMVGFDFGLGSNDEFSNAKVHFSVRNSF